MYEKAGNVWAAVFVDKTRDLARDGLLLRSYAGGPPSEISEAEGGGPWFLTWWGMATRERFVNVPYIVALANGKWTCSNFAFDWLKEEACRSCEDVRCEDSLFSVRQLSAYWLHAARRQ